MRRQCHGPMNTILQCKPKTNACNEVSSTLLERQIHNNFIRPYKDSGNIGLPGMQIFQKYCELLGTKYKKTQSTRLKLYKELLSIISHSKDIYVENVKLENESKNLRNYKNEALDIIQNLRSHISNEQFADIGWLSGTLNIESTQLKPLIYVQAKLDLNIAWYSYLYENEPIEYKKFNAIKQMIIDKGKENAYSELIMLLDEQHDTIISDLKKIEKDKIDT